MRVYPTHYSNLHTILYYFPHSVMNPWYLYLHLHYIYAEPCYFGRSVEYADVGGRVVDELEAWSWIGGFVSFDVDFFLIVCYFYYFIINYPVSPYDVQYLVQPFEVAYICAPSEVEWGYSL